MTEKFGLFGMLLDASFAAGVAFLVVAAARLLIGKAPKRWAYMMWAVVFFRCLCPFAAESGVSVFNVLRFPEISPTVRTEQFVQDLNAAADTEPNVGTAVPNVNKPQASDTALHTPAEKDGKNVPTAETEREKRGASAKTPQTDVRAIFTVVWLCGAAAMAFYGIVSAARLSARVRTAVRTETGVYESDRISTAFAAGIVRPKIYIPCGIPEEERRLIVMHERVHIRRRDYLFKALAFAGLSLHWFNPLIWAAFALMTRDMETSCDEAVLKNCGEKERILYAEALVRVSVRNFGAAAAVGFGETGIKERVKNVLEYKKQSKLTAVLAAAVMLASCTAAGTDAVNGGNSPSEPSETVGNAAEGAEIVTYKNYIELEPDLGIRSQRCYALALKKSAIVIDFPSAAEDGVWLIPFDRANGLKGMGAEKFILNGDGTVTVTFRMHTGEGKVVSPADGEVLWADGTSAVLDFGRGAVTYGDMSGVSLKAGDRVSENDVIGETAGNGYAGYAVQARIAVPENGGDTNGKTDLCYRVSIDNGTYSYTSNETRFIGDGAETVRLLEQSDLYGETDWYDPQNYPGGVQGHYFISLFSGIEDWARGETLGQTALVCIPEALEQRENDPSAKERAELTEQAEQEQLLRELEELKKREEENFALQREEGQERQLLKEVELRKAELEKTSSESGIKLVKPCPQNAKLSELYGGDLRNDGFNKGVNYGVETGTEVYAAADGRVIANSDKDNGYGICVIIEHDNGFATVYAHLSEAIAGMEDEVKAGDLIGYSGSTGRTYGSSLHFEVRENGQHVDPMPYLEN
ncbi:MAG: M23/M56 family metallopeptidase [Prevotella sp.]|nr:M23/M56 family metallopeptidase [Prevotella sp.]